MEDSLKKRYSIKLFANIISGVINAILISIVPSALGPISYGYFSYLQNFFLQIIGFLDMSTSIAFFTKLSANHARKELISFYFIYSILLLFVILIFIFVIDNLNYLSIFLPSIPKEYIYLGLFFGFFIWLTQVFIKISDAYAFTVSVEIIKIIHKIMSLLLLLYFIYQSIFDLKSYFYFHYITLVSFLFVLVWLFIKQGVFNKGLFTLKLDFKTLSKEFINYCSPLVIYSILGVIVGLFDIWLLQKMSGSIQTGFYGLAYSIAAMCFLFTSAMTPLITREFAKSYENNDLDNMKKLFKRYIPMLYSIAAFFGIFISFQSENLLAIFTDERFEGAFRVLSVIAFYPLFQTYGQLSGSIFYATGQTRLYKNIGIVNMLIGLFFSIIFLYSFEFGAVGLGFKILFSGVIGINIQLYFNAKFLDFKIKYFVLHQIYTVFFFILLAYASSNIITFNSPLMSFIFSGMIYTVLVIILSYIFPQIFATTKDEIKENLINIKRAIKK